MDELAKWPNYPDLPYIYTYGFRKIGTHVFDSDRKTSRPIPVYSYDSN